ncbi:MAG: hypothetical protein HWE23_13230 [Rhodobacteraceae bacterium]|nr:hypothetical protein [Paracoccaceae bacterium]
MIWSLSYDPLVPIWVLALAAGLTVILIVTCAVAKVRVWPLRALALSLLLLALVNPAIHREDREPLKSVVALVADRSQSQTIADRESQTDTTLESLETRLAAMPEFDVRVIDSGAVNSGNGTEIFKDLANGLADVPPEQMAGAIIISDGQVHDVPATADTLGFEAPVHGLITGRSDEKDRRLVLESAPKFGLVGSEQVARIKVVDYGADSLSASRIKLSIRRDGLLVHEGEITTGREVDVFLPITHSGDNIFELEAENLDGELTQINNKVVITIDGIRENLRVLLVSGSPHAGERTWRNLLKSDASVDLVHFTILRPPEKQDGTPINQLSLIAFPTRELFSVKIDEFDLIIFDRYVRRGVLPMLYFDNIARYVQSGGAVLLAGGPDYAGEGTLYQTPLAQILPARPTGAMLEEPFYATLASLGERHPVTRGLPGAEQSPPSWSRWFRIVETELDAGQTLLNGAGENPLLVLNREGEGRVAMLLSDHVWLWARGFEGGGPHVPLLRRLAHWLMKEPDLEEEALRATSLRRELQVERQSLQNTIGEVTVTTPSGATTTVEMNQAEPGLWRGTVQNTEQGLFTVREGERTTLVHIGPQNPLEFTDVISTTDKLSELTELTGGSTQRLLGTNSEANIPRILPMRQGTRFTGDGWIGLKVSNASILKGIDHVSLLSGLLGLAILFFALSMTWYREGK